MPSEKIVREIYKIIEAKKGKNILVLNLAGISLLADYFIICSGNSRVQTQALADYVEKEMSQQEVSLERREGYAKGRWILLDYGVVLLHIFLEEERQFYNLERLWGDAPVVEYNE